MKHDAVNHPAHYTSHPSGVEAIEITEHYNFCVGNAIKYLWRNGLKSDEGSSSVKDLKKAVWYINREISNIEKGTYNGKNKQEQTKSMAQGGGIPPRATVGEGWKADSPSGQTITFLHADGSRTKLPSSQPFDAGSVLRNSPSLSATTGFGELDYYKYRGLETRCISALSTSQLAALTTTDLQYHTTGYITSSGGCSASGGPVLSPFTLTTPPNTTYNTGTVMEGKKNLDWHIAIDNIMKKEFDK